MLLWLLLVGAAANDRRLTAVPIRLVLFVIRQESVQNNKRLKIFRFPAFDLYPSRIPNPTTPKEKGQKIVVL
jgi:hypothetical protein